MPPSNLRTVWSGHALSLATILLVAVLVRLHGLEKLDLWIDEAMTITISNWSFKTLFLYPVDPTPGLYYALHKVFIAPDASLTGMRSISLLSATASVGLIYALGHVMFGGRAGLIAALLLAVWPAQVVQSQDARAYALLLALTLCASLGVMLYARAWLGPSPASRGARWGALAIFALGTALSFHTHVTAIFWVGGTTLLVLVVAVLARRREAWVELLVSGVLVALLALPGLYRLYLESVSPNTFNWLQQASVAEALRTYAGVMSPPGPAGLQAPAAVEATRAAALLLLAALAVVTLRRSRPRFEPSTLMSAMLIAGYFLVPVALWMTGLVIKPIFMPRTILYAAPGAILLIALICDRAGRRLGLAVATALACACALVTLAGPPAAREQWRELQRHLTAVVKPGDVVLICPFWEYPVWRYAVDRDLGVRAAFVHSTGDLMEMEPTLGSERRWDLAYHQRVEALDAERALARELEDPPAQPAPRPIPLRAGASVWEIDGNCATADRAQLDGVLPAGLGPPQRVWEQSGEPGSKYRLHFVRRPVLAAGVIAPHTDVPSPAG